MKLMRKVTDVIFLYREKINKRFTQRSPLLCCVGKLVILVKSRSQDINMFSYSVVMIFIYSHHVTLGKRHASSFTFSDRSVVDFNKMMPTIQTQSSRVCKGSAEEVEDAAALIIFKPAKTDRQTCIISVKISKIIVKLMNTATVFHKDSSTHLLQPLCLLMWALKVTR